MLTYALPPPDETVDKTPVVSHLVLQTVYVPAPCATGKTYSAVDYVAEKLHLNNFIYLAPSKLLLSQTKAELARRGINGTVINSDTAPHEVKARILQYLEDPADSGTVLLITWAAYLDLPYFPNREYFEIIGDEVPQVDIFDAPLLPYNHEILSEHFEIVRLINEQIYQLRLVDPRRTERFCQRANDEFDNRIKPILRQALSPNRTVFVCAKSWARTVEKEQIETKRSRVNPGEYESETDKANRLYFLTMLNPSAFRDIILLGANLTDSLLYKWLTKYHGVHFREHKDIMSRLRRNPVDNKDVEIHYFVPGRHFSKSLAKKTGLKTDMNSLIDTMDERALGLFRGEPALYVANVGRKSEIMDKAANFKPIPVVSHGLNNWQGYHNIYISAAVNRQPKHFAMLESLGLSASEVHRGCAYEMAYQNVMRTSLRDPQSRNKVRVLAPDQPTATYLKSLFGPRTVVKQLDDLIDQPRKAFSESDKARRKRTNHFLKVTPNSLYNDNGVTSGKSDRRSTINPLLRPSQSDQLFWTRHPIKETADPDHHEVRSDDPQDFIRFLRRCSRNVVRKKAEAGMFSPCVFDPAKGGKGYRTKENFLQSAFLVLDFDGGTLSPKAFIDIFWRKAAPSQKRSFVICNTFNRSPDNPNKFRVITFYKRPAVSLLEHKAVLNGIIQRLEANGFRVFDEEGKFSLDQDSVRLDRQCDTGVLSYYLPCQNQAYPESRFFRNFGTRQRELAVHAIDPASYGKTALVKEDKYEAAAPTADNEEAKITKEEWDAIAAPFRSKTEGRRHDFYTAALKLHCRKLPAWEITAYLRELAGANEVYQKRIPEVMKSAFGYHLRKRRAA